MTEEAKNTFNIGGANFGGRRSLQDCRYHFANLVVDETTTACHRAGQYWKGRHLALRFSDHGPEFPPALIDALMAGEVVFLCGTGISAPQLPDFRSLVDQTFARLGVEMDASERRSYEKLRFEEVLGALGRRLADPEAMVRAVSELLKVPAVPRLDQHRTVLQLSRDQSNRVLIVTTNFDTLLEHALGQPTAMVQPQSFAGQSLPAPGGTGFAGIIHLHGRLVDPTLNLDATPMVLTSADYGDAYMRSGWASRFLFDLARCKTIVLIGYSANDAPVRYFLNVLEADRVRFPDLHPVYAFDAYEHDPVEAEASWGTLAVTPLVYCKLNPVTRVTDHSPLWDDLHQLADIIERPKRSREKRARNILVGSSHDLTDQKLNELSWLFKDRGDLWSIALDAITDPRWFQVLEEHKLWSAQDASLVITAWVAQNFEDRLRFTTAVVWHRVLGWDFLTRLDRRLRHSPPASRFWLKAWRILLSARPGAQNRNGGFDENAYALKQKLESGLILDRELAQALLLLTPVVTAREPYRSQSEEDAVKNTGEPRLSDLVSLDLSVDGMESATEVIVALDALDDHALRILELCSEALRSTQMQSLDLGMILEGYDVSDSSVPSVEDHGQNEYRNGVQFLVRATVNAFPKAVAANRDRARAQAEQWMTCPGRIGARMMLHVSRNAAAFSADEAFRVLLGLSDTDFWRIRREIALTLRDRAAEAQLSLREEVETRIRTSSSVYFARYPLQEGEVDWRLHASDSAVWLRLKMLEIADVLSEAGRNSMKEIVARRAYLDREVEDRDYFGSYSYGVRSIVGDTAPIVEAEPDDRLTIALELSQSPDLDRRLGWSAYCNSDPKGAFETLVAADLTAPNIALWGNLLAALAFRKDEKDAQFSVELACAALKRLESLNGETLRPIAASAVDLLMFGPRREIAHLECWCDRLWEAIRTAEFEIDFSKDVYEAAINHSGGRLAQVMLAELDHSHQVTSPDEARQRARLARVAAEESPTGTVVRAVLVHNFAYLLTADKQLIVDHLLPRLAADDDEGRALRAVLVSGSNITPKVTWLVSAEVLRGVVEARPDSGLAEQIASGILRPALAAVRGDDPDRWGLGATEVSRTLRLASIGVRVGTLDVLARWMRREEAGAEDAWVKMVAPFFDRIWPKERRFVDDALNRSLMSLAVGAGKHFPDALMKLRPYFCPWARENASVYTITQSQTPELFPDQVLDLLWLIFGQAGSSSFDMAEVLDRLAKAKPGVEADRRFQSLEQRTIRYS